MSNASNVYILSRKSNTPLMESASLRHVGLWAAVLLVGFLPLLIRFGTEQWVRPQYEFFPLILLAAAHLGWQRFHEISPRKLSCGTQRVTLGLLGIAMVLLVGASVLWSGRMAAISGLFALAGIAWRTGGWRMLRAMSPSGILLAVIIGLPVGMDEPFLQSLRDLAVSGSSHVLVWLGVPHLVTGTVIEIPGTRLLVAEACSGINSVMAVLGFTLVLGFWRRRSPVWMGGLVIAGVGFVLWANVVRIAGGVWLKSRFDIDILSGTLHQWASVMLFGVSMGLIFSTDQLISVVRRWNAARLRRRHRQQEYNYRRPQSKPAGPATPPTLKPVPVPIAVTGGLWILAMCFALVGVAQVANAAARGGIGYWIGGGSARATLRADAVFDVPDQVGNWRRSDEAQKLIAQPEIEGKKSQAWAYQRDDLTAVVAIDYPFPGFHDLTICYRNAGWSIQAQALQRPAPDAGAFTAVRASRLNECGYLLYALLDETGQWMEPPKASAVDRLIDRLRHFGRTEWNAPAYQVQVWVQTYDPLTDPQQQELSQLFLAVRQDLAQQVLKQLGGR